MKEGEFFGHYSAEQGAEKKQKREHQRKEWWSRRDIQDLRDAALISVTAFLLLGDIRDTGPFEPVKKAARAGAEVTRVYEQKTPQTEEKIKKIKELFGQNIEEEFYGETTETKQEVRATSVSDFEIGIPGPASKLVDSATVRQIIDTKFPRSFVQGEVSSITQSSEKDETGSQYGLAADTEAFASHYCRGREESQIVFYRPSQRVSLKICMNVLGHELGHANDWNHDNEMGAEERIDLLLAIADRLESDDRYQSSYVEGINNEDKQLEKVIKASEYFAEICEAYFANTDLMNYKDFEIVDSMVRKRDPDFDLTVARRAGDELIKKAY